MITYLWRRKIVEIRCLELSWRGLKDFILQKPIISADFLKLMVVLFWLTYFLFIRHWSSIKRCCMKHNLKVNVIRQIYLQCQRNQGRQFGWIRIKTCFIKRPSLLWQHGLWSFQAGGSKLERFLPKINILKGDYWILIIGLMGRCQKLDIILASKVI